MENFFTRDRSFTKKNVGGICLKYQRNVHQDLSSWVDKFDLDRWHRFVFCFGPLLPIQEDRKFTEVIF